MLKADAVQYFGGVIKLADALGLTKGAVSQWGDTVPLLRAYQIERLTDGALKAEEPELKKAS
tara:strand:+ start:1416 stop:1601 length:186 start_codon:yes stop_codon:yes gene_type:complete